MNKNEEIMIKDLDWKHYLLGFSLLFFSIGIIYVFYIGYQGSGHASRRTMVLFAIGVFLFVIPALLYLLGVIGLEKNEITGGNDLKLQQISDSLQNQKENSPHHHHHSSSTDQSGSKPTQRGVFLADPTDKKITGTDNVPKGAARKADFVNMGIVTYPDGQGVRLGVGWGGTALYSGSIPAQWTSGTKDHSRLDPFDLDMKSGSDHMVAGAVKQKVWQLGRDSNDTYPKIYTLNNVVVEQNTHLQMSGVDKSKDMIIEGTKGNREDGLYMYVTALLDHHGNLLFSKSTVNPTDIAKYNPVLIKMNMNQEIKHVKGANGYPQTIIIVRLWGHGVTQQNPIVLATVKAGDYGGNQDTSAGSQINNIGPKVIADLKQAIRGTGSLPAVIEEIAGKIPVPSSITGVGKILTMGESSCVMDADHHHKSLTQMTISANQLQNDSSKNASQMTKKLKDPLTLVESAGITDYSEYGQTFDMGSLASSSAPRTITIDSSTWSHLTPGVKKLIEDWCGHTQQSQRTSFENSITKNHKSVTLRFSLDQATKDQFLIAQAAFEDHSLVPVLPTYKFDVLVTSPNIANDSNVDTSHVLLQMTMQPGDQAPLYQWTTTDGNWQGVFHLSNDDFSPDVMQNLQKGVNGSKTKQLRLINKLVDIMFEIKSYQTESAHVNVQKVNAENNPVSIERGTSTSDGSGHNLTYTSGHITYNSKYTRTTDKYTADEETVYKAARDIALLKQYLESHNSLSWEANADYNVQHLQNTNPTKRVAQDTQFYFEDTQLADLSASKPYAVDLTKIGSTTSSLPSIDSRDWTHITAERFAEPKVYVTTKNADYFVVNPQNVRIYRKSDGETGWDWMFDSKGNLVQQTEFTGTLTTEMSDDTVIDQKSGHITIKWFLNPTTGSVTTKWSIDSEKAANGKPIWHKYVDSDNKQVKSFSARIRTAMAAPQANTPGGTPHTSGINLRNKIIAFMSSSSAETRLSAVFNQEFMEKYHLHNMPAHMTDDQKHWSQIVQLAYLMLISNRYDIPMIKLGGGIIHDIPTAKDVSEAIKFLKSKQGLKMLAQTQLLISKDNNVSMSQLTEANFNKDKAKWVAKQKAWAYGLGDGSKYLTNNGYIITRIELLMSDNKQHRVVAVYTTKPEIKKVGDYYVNLDKLTSRTLGFLNVIGGICLIASGVSFYRDLA